MKRRSAAFPAFVRDPDDDLAPVPDAPDGRTFDVFISHAWEDKDEVVRPLAHALQGSGLSVWYDEFELRIGDSLRRKIDKDWRAAVSASWCCRGPFSAKGGPSTNLTGW